MTKYSLSAASLVTAIPAAYLAYLLVMTFLQEPGFNNLTGPFQIIAGLTLTLVTLMVFMPVGILIFGKKPVKAAEPEKSADAEGKDDGEDLAVEDEDDFGESKDDLEVAGEADMFEDEGAEFEDDGLDEDLDDFEDDGFDDFDDDEFK